MISGWREPLHFPRKSMVRHGHYLVDCQRNASTNSIWLFCSPQCPINISILLSCLLSETIPGSGIHKYTIRPTQTAFIGQVWRQVLIFLYFSSKIPYLCSTLKTSAIICHQKKVDKTSGCNRYYLCCLLFEHFLP